MVYLCDLLFQIIDDIVVNSFLLLLNHDPEKINQAEMLEEEIQRVVNEKLPDKCRSIFILSRMEGRTNPEIAEILGLSIRTVENQIYRALKILKKSLSNYL